MTPTETLPHWQLTTIFPGLDSPEYQRAKAEFEKGISALERFMDVQRIRGGGPTIPETEVFEALLEQLNALYQDVADLSAYHTGFIATDAFNDRAQAERSSLQPLTSRLNTLSKRATAWFGGLELEPLLERSQVAREHRFLLEKAKEKAKHFMGDEAEALASALDMTGGSAWARLHSDLISRSTVSVTLPGRDEARELTISDLRNLQRDRDERVREAALAGELELLSRHEVSYAAALNSIKGQVNELSTRRGFSSALEVSLFDNNISAKSLGAMQEAVREALPDFRRYLKAKARRLGKNALGWSDLLAPVTKTPERRFGWDEAKAFVVEAFASYSAELSAFAERCFREGWLDAPPRKGKRNGAFCMGAPGRKESRVLLNFGGSLDDVFTLAHELGHAYHSEQQYRFGRTALQMETPMTLAETASIFCETVVVGAGNERSQGEDKLALLEQTLLSSTQVVLDIHSRFLFEKVVFEKRQERELSVQELKGLMLFAQAETYGEALEASERHPLMWAHKGHYYSSQRSFYNYPYTFGYLFGLGLYKVYRNEPEAFKTRYDELLASTGLSDAATLARGFGIDIETPGFWLESLSVAQEQAAEYERLVAA